MAQIDKEYAEALFTLAQEEGLEKETAEALSLIGALLEEYPAYRELLASPAMHRKERTGLLTEAFAGHVPESVFSFTCLLCERGHIRRFADCAGEYTALYRAAQELSVAEVTSAVALTETQKAALTAKLEKQCGHRVAVTYTEDPSLLGGVVVGMDGKVWDGSLIHRLRDMKEVMDG
ncbi:MAG: ATP synthase F1 subunit delta [Clostridia bacterium]|nr:ATP synthase F1 subunit delta [Clostridia bacterium]